ncbi:hypothetical protein UlMin_025116 [Ulmus minor]
MQKLYAKGVLWKEPRDEEEFSPPRTVVFRLSHCSEVSANGNCLFIASQKAMEVACEINTRELRKRTVMRFLDDFGPASEEEREAINDLIRHMYLPDLNNGWGIHVVHEVKLLAKKEDREGLDSSIDKLIHLGMQSTKLQFTTTRCPFLIFFKTRDKFCYFMQLEGTKMQLSHILFKCDFKNIVITYLIYIWLINFQNKIMNK